MKHETSYGAQLNDDGSSLVGKNALKIANLFFSCPQTRLLFAQLRASKAFETISK